MRKDVKSIWVGLRPLVKPQDDDGDNTKGLSREHTVLVSRSGLVTVTGGKWTTYRAMAEDVLEKCFERSLLARVEAGATKHLLLAGAETATQAGAPMGGISGWTSICKAPGLHSYGSEAPAVQSMPGADVQIADGLTEAMVRFAARHEYARNVEDVLARRSRLLFLDAALAADVAQKVGAILQEETGADPLVNDFRALCKKYLHLPQ